MRLAARPDSLGSLSAPPDPLAAIRGRGAYFYKGGGKGRKWEKERKGWEGGRKGKGREGRTGKGGPPSRIGKVQRWQL